MLPAPQLSAEYAIPHLTLKSAVGLTNQPKVDLAATTGYKDVVVGGEATYDSAKGQVTKWAAGVGALPLSHRRGFESVGITCMCKMCCAVVSWERAAMGHRTEHWGRLEAWCHEAPALLYHADMLACSGLITAVPSGACSLYRSSPVAALVFCMSMPMCHWQLQCRVIHDNEVA